MICTCRDSSYYGRHADSCPYSNRVDVDIDYIPRTLVGCAKCSVVVIDFDDHWAAVHGNKPVEYPPAPLPEKRAK